MIAVSRHVSVKPLLPFCLPALIAVSLLASCAAPSGGGTATATVQRMYDIDCGTIETKDISRWSPGYNVGKSFTLSDNCYLIQHGKDLMLWDTGLADYVVDTPVGISMAGGAFVVKRARRLEDELAEIGFKPSQVNYIAFSHFHADHAGNGNLFVGATLLIQQADYNAAFGPDANKNGFYPDFYGELRNSPSKKLNGDYDVFGDGSVTIISTPGHTPGHQSLMVRLPKRGTVILSGDIAHFKENWDNRRQPPFNFNKDQGLQSMNKIAALMEANHAELWINHDKAQSDTIPHSPAYIE
jgi:N-acyl homoserine lactone hydrolase